MTTQTERRTAHPYHMYDMVKGQPAAIARMLADEAEAIKSLAGSLESTERVHIVGIGTSWHASLVGEFLMRTVGGRDDTRAWNSFEFCGYPPRMGRRDAVIVMSHRGTKRFSAQALEIAKDSGARTAVFSGIGSNARADLADVVIRTSMPEKSSAFTISHTTALTGLAMLAAYVGLSAGRHEAKELQRDIERLPGLVEAVLAKERKVLQWAKETRDSERFYFTGWGPNASTAYEVALKIKETSYLVSEGFQLEQYLHGPFVATHPGCAVTFVAPPGVGRIRMLNLVRAANETGARTFSIAEDGDTEVQALVETAIPMPGMVEALTPIVYLVPLQLFTYWLAVESNCNPDVFRLDDRNHQAASSQYQL